ncbi:MAG: DUF167 domain-containing protein [Bdellovibrionota bacterium]|nr:DUF167 domain-containing protein [Bdellovibrionota bacterium]
MENLLQKIEEMGLRVFNSVSDGSQIEFSFNVCARPGSKIEKRYLGENGEVVLCFGARPVDGEANRAIFKILSKNLGMPQGHFDLEKGSKSKIKRFRVKIVFTDRKGLDYHLEKWKSLLIQR